MFTFPSIYLFSSYHLITLNNIFPSLYILGLVYYPPKYHAHNSTQTTSLLSISRICSAHALIHTYMYSATVLEQVPHRPTQLSSWLCSHPTSCRIHSLSHNHHTCLFTAFHSYNIYTYIHPYSYTTPNFPKI